MVNEIQSPLIILDRDGVINYVNDNYVRNADEWLPLPGSLEAIARLTRAGYKIAIASNQAGIAKGLYTEEDLAAIHEKLVDAVQAHGGFIDCIQYCPHRNEDLCDCRKPKAGMLLAIKNQFKVNLHDCYFVGDSYRDIQTAESVGAKAILLLTGYGKQTQQAHAELSVPVFENLLSFVNHLLR